VIVWAVPPKVMMACVLVRGKFSGSNLYNMQYWEKKGYQVHISVSRIFGRTFCAAFDAKVVRVHCSLKCISLTVIGYTRLSGEVICPKFDRLPAK
jgi:hypothetical protein